jgi:putative transposase
VPHSFAFFADEWDSLQNPRQLSQTSIAIHGYPHHVTKGLHRYYGTHDLHFITWSCYRRQPILGTATRRDLLLTILEQARRKYRFVVHGYVVMPEHVHLLISEPEEGDPSVVMKVVKQRFARQLKEKCGSTAPRQGQLSENAPDAVWQKRFYDFSVWTEHKRIEKLRYMHRNPVKRGLVEQPDQWKWSSFRAYFFGERGPVRVNFQEWTSEIKCRTPQKFGSGRVDTHPLIRKKRE